MSKHKIHDDDDGRTIVDMSGLTVPSLFGRPGGKTDKGIGSIASSDAGLEDSKESRLSREERRIYIFAALGASLLIAAAFIDGLGAAILFMILLWR